MCQGWYLRDADKPSVSYIKEQHYRRRGLLVKDPRRDKKQVSRMEGRTDSGTEEMWLGDEDRLEPD